MSGDYVTEMHSPNFTSQEMQYHQAIFYLTL